jgi:hypothetical protein
MKIKGESTSVKVLPWDPFATFNGGRADLFFCSYTLPEVNCNRYLPSKFVPKIRHVILIGLHAEGTKYAININM